MPYKKLTLALALVILFFNYKNQTDTKQTINPLLGDISFISKFGRQPTVATNEDLRIKTHLEYAENLLRQKDCSNLTPELQASRKRILDLLHHYWTTGVFPRNYEYQDKRVPCFIDKAGRICAVGFLIEKTAGRYTAEAVNANYKYANLLAMKDQTVESWVSTSGLTKEECAMIQPAYGWDDNNNNYISPEYGISSSVLGGVNLSLNAINAIQIGKGLKNKTVPFLGLLTGTGQIVIGVSNFPRDLGTESNESQKVLSMVNIGLGVSSVTLSSWNLFTDRPRKNKATHVNLFSFPANNRIGLGLRWTKKI